MWINNEESGLPTVWINECDYYQVTVEDCGGEREQAVQYTVVLNCYMDI